MESNPQIAANSGKLVIVGRIISLLTILFLLLDAFMKVFKLAPAVQGTMQLGYPESLVAPLGVILLLCVVVFVIPQTSILGAVFLTGYLGGAVASQLRIGSGLFPLIFAIIIGIMIWSGLYMRDDRLRSLFPLSK